MTEKELKSYIPICKQLERLEKMIEEESEREVVQVKGKVNGSMKEHPYIPVHIEVEMEDPLQSEKSNRKIRSWETEQQTLLKRKGAIERFIDEIADDELKLIFQYAFIDGKLQKEIGKLLCLERSYVSKKIKAAIKTFT